MHSMLPLPPVTPPPLSAMTQQAAVLQTCNNELVKCIEDLCNKRDALQRDISSEEDEKNKLQNDIRMLSER